MRTMASLILLFAACDSADSGRNTGGTNGTSGATNGATGGTNGGGGGDGGSGGVDDLAVNRDAFFLADPPPMYCGLDGGAFTPPTPPGGTLECPDDKNLEGCPCPTVGMTASCWPGKRANRQLGICMDGTTTCLMQGEMNPAWGPCTGDMLPDPAATEGANACKCFSHGQWLIDNTTLCGVGPTLANPTMAYPGTLNGNMIDCSKAPTGPSSSTDKVTSDCAGHFTLCYTIKAGKADMPMAADCVISRVCTSGDYLQVGMAQTFPPLPTWTSNNAACIKSFFDNGGYGEMSVAGTSITCDPIADHVFNRVGYCKASCSQPMDMLDPDCANCSAGGSGMF